MDLLQDENGRAVQAYHDGDEPPNDGNEWVGVDVMGGDSFWVLAQINKPARFNDFELNDDGCVDH